MLDEERLVWEKLGFDEGGLPTHLPMGVNAEGQGPENDSEAHHWECWCGDAECALTLALQHAWKAGRREGLRKADDLVGEVFADPGGDGQCSMGFAATVSQVLVMEALNG